MGLLYKQMDNNIIGDEFLLSDAVSETSSFNDECESLFDNL